MNPEIIARKIPTTQTRANQCEAEPSSGFGNSTMKKNAKKQACGEVLKLHERICPDAEVINANPAKVKQLQVRKKDKSKAKYAEPHPIETLNQPGSKEVELFFDGNTPENPHRSSSEAVRSNEPISQH
jgi:hypothetical protein